MTSEDRQQMNLDKAVGFFRRRGFLIVLCALIAGAVAFAISKSQTEEYEASSAVVFNEDQLTQAIAGVTTAPPNSVLQHASNLELLNLGNLSKKTAAKIGNGLSGSDVAAAITIEGSTESNVATISARSESAELAARIATVYAKQFVKQQGSASQRYFDSALALVREQIDQLKPGQRNEAAEADLFERANSLELLSELKPNSVEVVQGASVPSSPSSPTTKKNVLIGVVLGLFLGFGIALLIERADPRLRGPGELAAAYGAPLLGTVPRSPRIARYSLEGEGSDETEAFQVIRAQLGSFRFNAGRTPSIVLVSSATSGEGKSTVSFHLAAAAAQTRLRVLLIEADLRHPSLAERLGIDRAPTLLDAVIEPRALEHAAQVEVGTRDGGNLVVLPAGDVGGQARAAVIDSEALDQVLSLAVTRFDLVVVDGPELAGISDAFFLLGKTDGLIVVGSDRRSRRDIAEDLRHRLHIGGAQIFGVVANRVGRGGRRRSEKGAPPTVSGGTAPDGGTRDGIGPEAEIRA